MDSYSDLLINPVLTERHIQILWFEQKFIQNLTTAEGNIIEVVSPGNWNTGTGPDFLKAHLRIGGSEWHGDVELHLHDENWIQHKHDQDMRYNQVILHIAFWKPRHAKSIKREDGKEVFLTYLESSLTKPLEELLQLIDLDYYPYKSFIEKGKCSSLLFQKLPEENAEALFVSASYWRLRQKSHFLQLRFSTRPLQLFGGISMALGYKNNSMAFLDLFEFLLEYRDLPLEELLAITFGCTGFFDSHEKNHWKESHYYLQLKTLWGEWQWKVEHQAQLKLDHIRPFNHPIRRLAYLVHLLQNAHFEKVWAQLLKIWNGVKGPLKKSDKDSLYQNLLDCLPNFEDSYWASHLFFEEQSQSKIFSLIGTELKETIVINTFLPLLYEECMEKRCASAQQKFDDFYKSLKAHSTSKFKYLRHRFFDDHDHSFLKRAQIEQGMYQLHKDFCTHFEASCEGCPFVQRYFGLNNVPLL